MRTYKEQNQEIKALLKRIGTKCSNFAKQNKNPNFGDLGYVLTELKDIDNFLNDKYLTK